MSDDFKVLYDNLSAETEKLNYQLDALKEKNNYLLSRIDALLMENESLKSKVSKEELYEASSESRETPVDRKKEISPDFEYGAKAIGKVVISATVSCNSLSAKSDNPITKELVNLILGKTEAAKADILKIVECEAELEIKKEMIDKVVESSEEYFMNVRAQI